MAREVIQEFIFFHVSDGKLVYRVEYCGLPEGEAPKSHALGFLGWDKEENLSPEFLLHSTSWRASENGNEIFLTWAVIPDGRGNKTGVKPVKNYNPIVDEDVAELGSENFVDRVASHAARHLAFLSHTDGNISDAIHYYESMHDALLEYAPDVAGGIFHRIGG